MKPRTETEVFAMQVIDYKRSMVLKGANNKYSDAQQNRVYCPPQLRGFEQSSRLSEIVGFSREIAVILSFVGPWVFTLYMTYGLVTGGVKW